MNRDFDQDYKEREMDRLVEEPEIKAEQIKIQSPNLDAFGRDRCKKDKCKKKPDHGGQKEFIFLVFLILILLLLSDC